MNVKAKKILAGTALVLAVVVALGLAVRAILNFTAGKQLENEIKKLKAEGYRLSVRDFTPPCRDADNAGLTWRALETMFVKDFNSQTVIHAPWRSLAEGKSLDPASRAVFYKTAEKYLPLFQLIREAAKKPCFRYARRWNNVSFNLAYINLKKLEPLIQLFLINSYLQAEEGRLDSAVQDFLASLRNAAFFMREPHPFNRMYCSMILQEQLIALWAVLARGVPDDQACQSLLAALDGLRLDESLRRGFQLERAMILEEYVSIIQGRYRGDLMEKTYSWMVKPKRKSEALYVLKNWIAAEDVFDVPYPNRQKWLDGFQEKTKKPPRSSDLAAVFFPPIPGWALTRKTQLQAMVDVTRTALACRIYQRRHGRFPESLDRLAPEILPQVPADPFSGKPLIYRPSGTGFTVYSLGPNQKDDGGRGSWDLGFGPKPEDDIALSL